MQQRPGRRTGHGPWGRWLRLSLSALVGLLVLQGLAVPSGAVPTPPASCQPLQEHPMDPSRSVAMATRIVRLMTLDEKVGFLGLAPDRTRLIQQANPGVPRLCVPPLVLRDGPVGVAGAARGVTPLPSELNLAATFSTQLATSYGSRLGGEARAQGVMGIQGPGLDVSVFDNWGRSFENLGEDPTLTSVLGSSMIEGIQSTGEIAMAKHLGTYEQETTRGDVDYLVSQRAREEVYLAPFRAAARAGVGSMMCAIGSTNGVEACSDAAAIAELQREGFDGLIRTDAGATTDEVAALKSGVELFRPYDPAPILAALANGTLAPAVLDAAVRNVLTVMYRFGDMHWPALSNATRPVTSPGAVATSLAVADDSAVLLKNDGILPLVRHHAGTIAVIGSAASEDPILAGTGSSQVYDRRPVTDLTGILHVTDPRAVTYVSATTTSGTVQLTPGPTSEIGSLPGYQQAPLSLPAGMAGLVDFSYASLAPARLLVDGSVVLSNPDTTAGRPISFERAIQLGAGHHDVVLQWPDGQEPPTVSAQPVGDLIAQAAAAAHDASTAVVVVGERDGEGFDRPSLALPGYQDQLVEAVAAANPRTIVVVHSGGPVLMPWRGSVAAVLEMWYPGEVAGTALADVLTGAVDPSGRLPVAFPRSDARAPMSPAGDWPAAPTTSDLVALGDLGVGSRWYEAHGIAPLYAFGYGLSYTRFVVHAPSARLDGANLEVTFTVQNTGRRAGRYVALVDVTAPPGSGEPAGELRAFAGVMLPAGGSATLRVPVPLSSLQVYEGGWRLVPGRYVVAVGPRSTAFVLH